MWPSLRPRRHCFRTGTDVIVSHEKPEKPLFGLVVIGGFVSNVVMVVHNVDRKATSCVVKTATCVVSSYRNYYCRLRDQVGLFAISYFSLGFFAIG